MIFYLDSFHRMSQTFIIQQNVFVLTMAYCCNNILYVSFRFLDFLVLFLKNNWKYSLPLLASGTSSINLVASKNKYFLLMFHWVKTVFFCKSDLSITVFKLKTLSFVIKLFLKYKSLYNRKTRNLKKLPLHRWINSIEK